MTELEKQARLAAVERELSRLDVRHELAMSAFKFDEARDLQQRIAVLEHERAALVEALPPRTEPTAAVPSRSRRLVRRRRRLLRR